MALWLEYEDCSSPEARVVKDFDRSEMTHHLTGNASQTILLTQCVIVALQN